MRPHPRVPVSLRRLFPHASFVGCADVSVTDATDSSHACFPGAVFAAVRGLRHDGSQFVRDAVQRGAKAVLIDRPLADVPVPQCVVSDVRRAHAELCAALHGHPASRLKLTGVTGTNGKTTVTWMLRAVLQAAGRTAGLLGTVEYDDGLHREAAKLTTPEPHALQSRLSRMVDNGVTHAAMEVSSHALDQHRLAGTELAAAVITNVTQDHFDYHGGFDSYRTAKARIVNHLGQDAPVIVNVDDDGSRSLVAALANARSVIRYGMDAVADVSAVVHEESLAGSRFEITARGNRVAVHTRLVGRHNVSNCLAAAAAALELGFSLEDVRAGLESLEGIPGRLEAIDEGQPFEVFVDYAHTDDALRRAVACLKSLTTGRVICVFGAGGDRDRTKRPLLGRAAQAADLPILTSDNPRTEDPVSIIEDVLAGFDDESHPLVVADRGTAIREAVRQARSGDSVLVAGKGHENEQHVGSRRIPFDDRAVVRSALASTSREEDVAMQVPA